MAEKLLTIKEAAAALGYAEITVRAKIKAGKLTAIQGEKGDHIKLAQSEVDRYKIARGDGVEEKPDGSIHIPPEGAKQIRTLFGRVLD